MATVKEGVLAIVSPLTSAVRGLRNDSRSELIATRGTTGTWIISGLTVGKDLIIGYRCTTVSASGRMRVVSGSEIGESPSGGGFTIGPAITATTGASSVLIPTDDTVVLNISLLCLKYK